MVPHLPASLRLVMQELVVLLARVMEAGAVVVRLRVVVRLVVLAEMAVPHRAVEAAVAVPILEQAGQAELEPEAR